MNSNNYQIQAIKLGLNYFDNRVDNEFTPYSPDFYNNGSSDCQRRYEQNAVTLDGVRLKLNDIHSGTVLVPIRSGLGTTYDSLILKDKLTRWSYVYFLEDTGRIFNELKEFKISLNYFATYGEQFLGTTWGDGTPNLWHKMNIYKSNQIPIPSDRWDSSSTGLINPNVQKWTWMNQSVTELPEDLKVENNNEDITNYKYNIFNATYVPNNQIWKNCTLGGIQRFNLNQNQLGLTNVSINVAGQQRTYQIMYNNIKEIEGKKTVGSFNIRPLDGSKWANNSSGFIGKNILRAFQSWDSEWWALAIVNFIPYYNGTDNLSWHGRGDAPINNIIAIPCNEPWGIIQGYKQRFAGTNIHFLSLVKFKSQNWLTNQGPRSVVLLNAEDLTLGLGGWRDDVVVACPYLTGLDVAGFDIPAKYNYLGWYHRIRIQLSAYKPTRTFSSAPKTWTDISGVMRLCSGYTRAIINTGASWIIYDWTKFNGYWFDLFYSNLGYEYMWIEPNFDVNNPYKNSSLRPWQENKNSLGLVAIRETNLNRFDSSLMQSIRQNANQWQVGQNQAQYNYGVAKSKNMMQSFNKMFNPWEQFKFAKDLVFKPTQAINEQIGYAQAQGNAKFDTMKLPAMYQDMQTSNTGTYPAGDSYLIEWEVPSLWLVEWNVDFIASVYNYVTKNGWYNVPPNWNSGDLSYRYCSGILHKDSQGNYIISGYLGFAKFRRDLNQIAKNVRAQASALNLSISNRVIEWFADWFSEGIRFYYPYGGTRAPEIIDREEMRKISQSNVEIVYVGDEERKIRDEEIRRNQEQNENNQSRTTSRTRKPRNGTTRKTNSES